MTFKKITEEMVSLQEKKNRDYGGAFEKSCDEFGITTAAIRLGDKYNRFKSLIRKDALVEDESIEDTLIDMAAYAIMTVSWLRKKNANIQRTK